MCVLVGIHRSDTRKELDYMVRKVLNLRLFEDPDSEEGSKRWNKSAKDLNLELLCISQFTLYHTLKGNKPDFHLVMIQPFPINMSLKNKGAKFTTKLQWNAEIRTSSDFGQTTLVR